MNTIVYRLLRKKYAEPLYVLYLPYNIDFELDIANDITNALFFVLPNSIVFPKEDRNIKLEHERFIICDKKLEFKPYQRPHIIMCNHRRQIGYSIKYSNIFHCPIVLVDHKKPLGPNDIEILQSNKAIEQNKNFNIVSLSEEIEASWNTKSQYKYILNSDYKNLTDILEDISLRTYIR